MIHSEIVFYYSVDSTTGPSILDGSITIDSVMGGVLPYSFQWADSIGNVFSTSSSSVTIKGLISTRAQSILV